MVVALLKSFGSGLSSSKWITKLYYKMLNWTYFVIIAYLSDFYDNISYLFTVAISFKICSLYSIRFLRKIAEYFTKLKAFSMTNLTKKWAMGNVLFWSQVQDFFEIKLAYNNHIITYDMPHNYPLRFFVQLFCEGFLCLSCLIYLHTGTFKIPFLS